MMTMCQTGGPAADAHKSQGSRLREMTFLSFASVEYDGNIYMTPDDFLQSMVDDKPRCTHYSSYVIHKCTCLCHSCRNNGGDGCVSSYAFYPRDAMLARVIAIATCPSVRSSRAGIVSKQRKLVA